MNENKVLNNNPFKLLVCETIKFINAKNITPRDKLIQIEEFGVRIGERIVNFILNKFGGKTKLETEEVIKFVSNKVWAYVFSKPVNKVQTNKKGVYYYEVDEISLFFPIVRQREPTTEDTMIADFLLTFLSGIIKGALQVFDIETIVNGICKFDLLYNELINGYEKPKNEGSQTNTSPFLFNIMILNT